MLEAKINILEMVKIIFQCPKWDENYHATLIRGPNQVVDDIIVDKLFLFCTKEVRKLKNLLIVKKLR